MSTERAQRFASVGLALLPAISWPTWATVTPPDTEPIRLSLTFIQSNPITTITVGGRTIQAVVDTGGDVDGALTLSREVIDGVGAASLGGAIVSTDSFGRDFTRPRFRVPLVTIGGHTFENLTALQAPDRAPGDGPPVPNGIGRQFLSQYFVVVDYAGAAITLWPRNAKRTAPVNCGRTRLAMEHTVEDALAVSDFDTQAGRVRLLWDTGASYSALPETIADKRRLATTARGQTKFWQAKVFSRAGRDLGSVEFVLLPLKLPEDFQGLLGHNFFERHVVCLDYQLREVRVR